jgi:hypothetical protein
MKNASLTNLENYKDNIEYSVFEVNTKYINIIIEYLTNIINNDIYSTFIIIRGIETISHTFKYILYYTNNLDLTYYHSQKALYLYIEFINQITTDRNVFLQLNSRDALMYVYKKTIFELDRVYCKDICDSNKKFVEHIKQVNEFIELSTSIIFYILNNKETLNINADIIRTIHKICNNIINIKLYDYSICSLFIQKLNVNVIHLEKYADITILFFKKLINNTIDKNNIINMNIIIENIETCSIDKFITLLFSN